VQPWLDEEDLLPGQNWQQEIRQTVDLVDVVIVFLSRQSMSRRGFVHKEISFALDIADEQPTGTIFVIPAKLEACEVPERLRKWHWVNLFEDRGYEKLMRALRHRARELGIIIQPPDPQPTTPAASSAFSVQRSAFKALFPVTPDEWHATSGKWLVTSDEHSALPSPSLVTEHSSLTSYWCPIPAGTYRIGGWKEGERSPDITLPAFWIA
jgi:hypothetical protein